MDQLDTFSIEGIFNSREKSFDHGRDAWIGLYQIHKTRKGIYVLFVFEIIYDLSEKTKNK